MTIEVRQMLIKSTIGGEMDTERESENGLSAEDLERLREDLFDQCKTWLMEKLRESRER